MKLRYKIMGGTVLFLATTVVALVLVVSHTSDCAPVPAIPAGAETMKAITYRCYGSPEVLEFTDIEKPVPADNEVLVKVVTAAVNPLDWHFMRGRPYFMRLMSGIGTPKNPRLGVDFAGIVEAIGKDVQHFSPGDAVFGGANGAYAEYVTVAEDRSLALKPANITFAEAAAVPIAGITALQALRDKGQLEPGDKVLINGASGGVGTFAVQIAKALGAEVTGVCSTRNLDMVRRLGAAHVIDYTRDDYTQRDEKYDLIVDMVGNHSLSANRKVLTGDGTLVMVGGANGDWIEPLMGALEVLLVAPFIEQQVVMILAKLRPDDLAELADFMQAGDVTPEIDRHYSLREVPDAIRYSEKGHARGKIIIDLQ